MAPFEVSPLSKAASERSAARQRTDEAMPAKTSEWRDFLLAQARMPPAARAPAEGTLGGGGGWLKKQCVCVYYS